MRHYGLDDAIEDLDKVRERARRVCVTCRCLKCPSGCDVHRQLRA